MTSSEVLAFPDHEGDRRRKLLGRIERLRTVAVRLPWSYAEDGERELLEGLGALLDDIRAAVGTAFFVAATRPHLQRLIGFREELLFLQKLEPAPSPGNVFDFAQTDSPSAIQAKVLVRRVVVELASISEALVSHQFADLVASFLDQYASLLQTDDITRSSA